MARTPDSDMVRHRMEILTRVVKEIRHEYPRMELGQLHVLLLALARPGISMTDMVAPADLTRQSISRNVLALSRKPNSAEGESSREGLDLVVQLPDPSDSRSKLVAPSLRGRRLAERLNAILERV